MIISADLDYNGGSIAAVYAAKILQKGNNNVFLAAHAGNQSFINEIVESGINVVLCPAFPYIHKEEMFWIQQFDLVVVNVFQMILCAYKISYIKPVLWWIHESGNVYDDALIQFGEYIEKEQLKRISIYAVSNIAERGFNVYVNEKIKKILPYGIPDQRKIQKYKEKREGSVFAIIGSVCPLKAQDIFLKAIGLLSIEEKRNMEFWIIGYIGMDEYSARIKRLADMEERVRVLGLQTRSEIFEVYRKIDVVVCPSIEDSLPMVVTEGMMYEKICIVSNGTGSAQYIDDGKNGFICNAGDATDLCNKMKYIIHNKDNLLTIGRNARRVYEEYFTLDKFGEKMEAALEETMDNWKHHIE